MSTIPSNQFDRYSDRVLKAVDDAQRSESGEDSDIGGLLMGLIKRAKRQNVWRRSSSISRGILNLCVRLPLKFKAQTLLRSLVKSLKEVLLLLSPRYRLWVSGWESASRMSEAACRWGNRDAARWIYDNNYILCTGLNIQSGFTPRT